MKNIPIRFVAALLMSLGLGASGGDDDTSTTIPTSGGAMWEQLVAQQQLKR